MEALGATTSRRKSDSTKEAQEIWTVTGVARNSMSHQKKVKNKVEATWTFYGKREKKMGQGELGRLKMTQGL